MFFFLPPTQVTEVPEIHFYLQSCQVVRLQESCKIHIPESACVRIEKLPDSEIFSHLIQHDCMAEISITSRMHTDDIKGVFPPSSKNVGVYPLSLANQNKLISNIQLDSGQSAETW
jgi:hypothetical protein